MITNLETADYFFSSDASHPDTKRIHESLDYIEDRIAIFHCSYLTAAESAGMKNTVALGHFLLPPACLHQEIREKIGCFVWEQVTNPLKLQTSRPEVNSSNKEEEQRNERELERSEENHSPEILERRKQPYIPLQGYPASNMLTGYASAKEMKKFVGEIRDFIPGHSGYLAYWIPNSTNIFSQVKTK